MPHVYTDILDSVQKPVRYIGNEWSVIKKPWDAVGKHVLLGFPDSYDIRLLFDRRRPALRGFRLRTQPQIFQQGARLSNESRRAGD